MYCAGVPEVHEEKEIAVAKVHPNVLYIGNADGAGEAARVIKKFKHPDNFTIASAKADGDTIVAMQRRITELRISGDYPPPVEEHYERVRIISVAMLSAHPDADIAILVYRMHAKGASDSSHFVTRALLTDAMRKPGKPWRLHHAHHLIGEVTAPYLHGAPQSILAAQEKRNTATAMGEVFEGWQYWWKEVGQSVTFL